MSDCRGPSCHDCKDREREIEAIRAKVVDINATVQIARCVLVGAVAVLLTFLAGCLISHEWTLKSLQEVKGRVEVQHTGPMMGGPEFRVDVKPEKAPEGK